MIHVDGLAVSRDGRPVLEAVSFNMAADESLAVLGSNGAGKTTLLKTVAGLGDPDSGTVTLDGVAGFAPEDPEAGLFAESVAEELAFFPRNRGLEVEPHREAALEALGLTPYRDRDPFTLSVGEQRRVSIAAVLAGDPDILVLDDPTRGLDAAGERHLAKWLEELELPMLWSTHDADFAWTVADRIAVLADGTIDRVDNARAVLIDEERLAAAGVRPPGIVRWARSHGIDPPPADLGEAIARLEATP